MTQVFIHPEIEDYFVEYDFRETAKNHELRRRIVEDYHGEKLILLRNLNFDADLTFLRSVSFYQKWKWKKLALSSFELIAAAKRREVPEIGEFVQDVFGGDWGRFDYFIDQAKVINDQLRSALGTIFANYEFSRRDIIWRFTETRVENLHFDVDRNCDNLELIRLYANFDDIPRVWYTAGTFTATAHEWYTKLDLSRFRGQPHDKLLKELSTRIYGDWHKRGRDTVPRHLVLFEPGDVWLTDGRLVSHQVIYGRRVVSTLFVAGADTVPNPKATFAQKVADLHRSEEEFKNGSTGEAATTRSVRAISEKPRKPLDLSASWEDLPDHVRKGTLVRL
jgi:hypothetical protein